jgi:hypothetical protein
MQVKLRQKEILKFLLILSQIKVLIIILGIKQSQKSIIKLEITLVVGCVVGKFLGKKKLKV